MGYGGKDGGKLQEGAITAGTRDDADATPGHGVGNPVGRADGGAGQEDGVLLDEGDGSRLDRVPGSLNFVEGLGDVKDDRLRLGTAGD